MKKRLLLSMMVLTTALMSFAQSTMEVNTKKLGAPIQSTMYGIFFEDINFAADGGLYAEMVQNCSFEFTSLAAGNDRHAWSDVGTVNAQVKKGDGQEDKASGYSPLNENNPNYMTLENTSAERAGISNKGFLDGMAIKENESYKASAYIKSDDYNGKVYFALCVGDDVWQRI